MNDDMGRNHKLWSNILNGHVVLVNGITEKGKDRVLKHGRNWRVKTVLGLRLLTFSTKTGYKRWINGPNDNDFKVIGVNTGLMIIAMGDHDG